MTDCEDELIEFLEVCPVCEHKECRQLPSPKIIIGEKFFENVLECLRLVRCSYCGHVYQKVRPSEPMLNEFYQSASNYDPFGATHDDIGKIADRLRLDFIEEHVKHSSIVDFGGGGGRFARSAINRGWNAQVVELSEIGREQCKRNNVTAFASLDDIVGRSFKLASMIHVLEHVGNPVKTLQALKQVIDKDGGVYIEVPNLQSLRARLYSLLLKRTSDDCWFRAFPTHLHGFSKKSLGFCLKRAGFNPVVWQTYGGGIQFNAKEGNCVTSSPNNARNDQIRNVNMKKPRNISFFKRFLKKVVFNKLLLGENLCVYAISNSSLENNME